MIKINATNIHFTDLSDSAINMKPYMNTGIATKVYSLIDISLKCCMNNAINTLVDNAKKVNPTSLG